MKRNVISTCKKKQRNKKLISKLDETSDDFIFTNARMGVENTNVVEKGLGMVNSYNAIHPTAKKGPQVDMQTLETNFPANVKSEVENVVATVETKVHEAIFSAMDTLVVLRMELAMRSVGSFLKPNPGSVVIDPHQRDLSGDTNGLHMTALSRFNSNT